jgi:hypothetical protein
VLRSLDPLPLVTVRGRIVPHTIPEGATLPPRTDAHALHDLLAQVRDSGKTSVSSAWAQVLDAQIHTVEFARRHMTVVGLLDSTLRQIEGLPTRSRDRFQPYVNAWWSAVCAPNWQWNSNVDIPNIISNEHLHLLESAGDIIEDKLELSVRSPGGADLAALREQVEEWLRLVEGETDLPLELRRSVLQDFSHLIWLMDNVELFGVAAVAETGQTALGGVALAGAQLPKDRQPKWREKVAAFAGSLLMLAGAMDAGRLALESGEDLVGEVVNIVQVDADRHEDALEPTPTQDQPE